MQTVAIPGYRVTLDSSWPVVTVTVDHDFPVPNEENRRVGNAMVWLDGENAGELYGPPLPGQVMTYNAEGNRVTVTWTLDRGIKEIPPGEYELVVSLWPQTNPSTTSIPYLRDTLIVPSRPAPALVPSTFVRAMFWTDPTDVDTSVLFAAGVTHLTTGVFRNPANTGAATYDAWYADWSPWIDTQIAALGPLRLFAEGDDFLRFENQRDWVHDSPWAAQAIAAVATKLVSHCDAMAVVDEVGGTPETDSAYLTFVNAWRSVPGAPKLGWPVVGVSDYFPFEIDPYFDYRDRYWDDRSGRVGRADGSSTLSSIALWMKHSVPVTFDRPWTALVGAMGPSYKKRVVGPNYHPPEDELDSAGPSGPDITAQIWLAVLFGAAGVRIYAYDSFSNRADRLAFPLGEDVQTGIFPTDPRWSWLSVALNAITNRESEIVHGHWYTPNLVDGVWVGRRGDVGIAVNTRSVPTGHLSLSGTLLTENGEIPYSSDMDIPPGGVVLWRYT